jgi:hypothetical protein
VQRDLEDEQHFALKWIEFGYPVYSGAGLVRGTKGPKDLSHAKARRAKGVSKELSAPFFVLLWQQKRQLFL